MGILLCVLWCWIKEEGRADVRNQMESLGLGFCLPTKLQHDQMLAEAIPKHPMGIRWREDWELLAFLMTTFPLQSRCHALTRLSCWLKRSCRQSQTKLKLLQAVRSFPKASWKHHRCRRNYPILYVFIYTYRIWISWISLASGWPCASTAPFFSDGGDVRSLERDKKALPKQQ